MKIDADIAKLIDVLGSVPNAAYMAQIRQTYQSTHRRDLVNDLRSETSGDFRDALLALARGPAEHDAHLVHAAIKGLGTSEALLNDALLGRSAQSMGALKAEYSRLYRTSIEKDVVGDLSLDTKGLFAEVLRVQRHPEGSQIPPQVALQEGEKLWRATDVSKDSKVVTEILTTYSSGELRMIAQEYLRYSKGTPVDKVVARHWSGHMKDAYLLMLARAIDPAKADADALEDAMKGAGTREGKLSNSLIRAHWDREHFGQVMKAYQHFYHRDLEQRVNGETSSYFGKLLVKICAVGRPRN